MKRSATGLGVALLAWSLAACGDPLQVNNVNNPDIDRALGTANGIEQLISTGYQQIHGEYTGCCPLQAQGNAYSLESFATVANFGMGLRVSIPRSGISNERGNITGDGNYDNFRDFAKISRSMANGIQALDRLIVDRGGTLGSPGRDARARAFAFFVMGVAQGSAALIYDSVAVLTHKTAPSEIPPLSSYNAAMAVSLEMLDSAIATANGVAAAQVSNFTITNWLNGVTLNRAQFIQLANSFKARFRAGVARNATERAAVNWNTVIAEANAGITSDVVLTLSNSAGWPHGYLAQMYTYGGWHQMAPNYLGFADSAGGEFDTWLSTNMNRGAGGDPARFYRFNSADRRMPAGNTRTAQIAASGCTGGNNVASCLPGSAGGISGVYNQLPYFRNRNGDDTSGDPWGQSQYDHYRFRYLTLLNSGRDGPYPTMTLAEIQLLAAEGYIRTNQVALAVPLINRTRQAQGGLPSALGATGTFTSFNSGLPVPGGNACVPRVAVPTGNNTWTRACGDLVEALKWEKRLETQFTGFMQWYVDSRGWGDLPEGTAESWPVPYQELDSRVSGNTNFYGLGGQKPKGNYGW